MNDDFNAFFDSIIGKKKENDSTTGNDIENTITSELTDKKFENNLRAVLEKKIPITRLKYSNFDLIKEFKLYKIELFNKNNREIIKSKIFFSDEKYYYINLENEYFFISSDDLANLNYYDSISLKNEKIKGFEETQLLSNDSAKLFLEEDQKKKITDSNEKVYNPFFDDIKLNLISNKTISYIGNNNDIPNDLLAHYYVKGKLLSHGKSPHAICFGKDKDNKPSTGTIHYPMEKYYIKLTLRKGQFDGAYSCTTEFELSQFKCDIIYQTFNKIPKDSAILFEFKNGDGGENKIISQAVNYQENAIVILKGQVFYHIIIIRSKKLGIALKNKKEQIEKKKLNNFAILCLNNDLVICGEKFNEKKVKKKYKKSESSESTSRNNESNIKEELIAFRISLMEELKAIEERLDSVEAKLSLKIKDV